MDSPQFSFLPRTPSRRWPTLMLGGTSPTPSFVALRTPPKLTPPLFGAAPTLFWPYIGIGVSMAFRFQLIPFIHHSSNLASVPLPLRSNSGGVLRHLQVEELLTDLLFAVQHVICRRLWRSFRLVCLNMPAFLVLRLLLETWITHGGLTLTHS
ncbi:hypothetical protein NMY22_g5471 [Coprinellus aureogranulatus]|nr:hypothetical protein NMY22_g5471 [Coprinellus aureogranulatus]